MQIYALFMALPEIASQVQKNTSFINMVFKELADSAMHFHYRIFGVSNYLKHCFFLHDRLYITIQYIPL